jgi:hypothetical protein
MYRLIVCVCVMFAAPTIGVAETIFESATFGPFSDAPMGYAIANYQFQAARFHLDTETVVDHIGGRFGGNGTSKLLSFGAIAELGASGFPDASPLTFQPIASATFSPANANADTLVPLSVTLPPGDYALIFGAGRFGSPVLPDSTTDILTHNPETPQASYFSYNELGGNDIWTNDADDIGLRFFVTGTPVLEPSTLVLAVLGTTALLAYRRRGKSRRFATMCRGEFSTFCQDACPHGG